MLQTGEPPLSHFNIHLSYFYEYLSEHILAEEATQPHPTLPFFPSVFLFT
jgi:hypothetical protein